MWRSSLCRLELLLTALRRRAEGQGPAGVGLEKSSGECREQSALWGKRWRRENKGAGVLTTSEAVCGGG